MCDPSASCGGAAHLAHDVLSVVAKVGADRKLAGCNFELHRVPRSLCGTTAASTLKT
jgi:hypothetical protein